MNLEGIFQKLDRIAGGRAAAYRVPDELRSTPALKRAFIAISWLLLAAAVLGVAAVVVAIVLVVNGVAVPFAVWMRALVVLGMTLTLFYFAWRAEKGFYWGYQRLRLFSKIFPVVTLVMAAIPGLYPLWMVTEQILFSLLLIGVSDYLTSDLVREAFPKPPKAARPARGTAQSGTEA